MVVLLCSLNQLLRFQTLQYLAPKPFYLLCVLIILPYRCTCSYNEIINREIPAEQLQKACTIVECVYKSELVFNIYQSYQWRLCELKYRTQHFSILNLAINDEVIFFRIIQLATFLDNHLSKMKDNYISLTFFKVQENHPH